MWISFARWALAVTLTLLAAAAFPQPPESREQALALLASPDAATRAQAIVWIARHGGDADATLLYARLRDDDPGVRAYAEQALWLVWSRSGDAAVDRLMERGTEEMHSGRHREAIATFSQVIQRKPGFAEGWNKRATVHFLVDDYSKAIADIERTLALEPRHFGALSGLGTIMRDIGENERAVTAFRRALDVDPHLDNVKEAIEEIEKEKAGQDI